MAGLAFAKSRFPRSGSTAGGVTNVHAAVDGPPPVPGLSTLQAGAHLLWGSPPRSSGSLASPGCGQRPFPLRRILSCHSKTLPMALLGQPLQTPRDHLAPKQWENFSPLLGHRTGGSWSCSPPAPQSLQSPLARCEWGRDPRGPAHPARERGPEAVFSWLPSGRIPAPLRTPGSWHRSQPSRRGDRGPRSGGGRRRELRPHWRVASARLPEHRVGWRICGKPAREPRGRSPAEGFAPPWGKL